MPIVGYGYYFILMKAEHHHTSFMPFHLNLFELSIIQAAYYKYCSIVIAYCELAPIHIHVIAIYILPMLCPHL